MKKEIEPEWIGYAEAQRLNRYYLPVSFYVQVDCDREEGVIQWYLRGLPLFT